MRSKSWRAGPASAATLRAIPVKFKPVQRSNAPQNAAADPLLGFIGFRRLLIGTYAAEQDAGFAYAELVCTLVPKNGRCYITVPAKMCLLEEMRIIALAQSQCSLSATAGGSSLIKQASRDKIASSEQRVTTR